MTIGRYSQSSIIKKFDIFGSRIFEHFALTKGMCNGFSFLFFMARILDEYEEKNKQTNRLESHKHSIKIGDTFKWLTGIEETKLIEAVDLFEEYRRKGKDRKKWKENLIEEKRKLIDYALDTYIIMNIVKHAQEPSLVRTFAENEQAEFTKQITQHDYDELLKLIVNNPKISSYKTHGVSGNFTHQGLEIALETLLVENESASIGSLLHAMLI